MLKMDTRMGFEDEHHIFRDQVRKFFDKELVPHLPRWEQEGICDRDFWNKSGSAGLLCPNVPEEYGGLGLDFRYNAIVDEELSYYDCVLGFAVHSDIVCHYIMHYGSEEQKRTWLPKMVSGEAVAAIGMTEPGAGSDLKSIVTSAVRDGDEYVINGSKIYITNGQHADFVLLACKTDRAAGAKGVSLIIVEADRKGYVKGRNLDKAGQHHADTSELFFNDVRVPVTNLLGQEGKGFAYMMTELPQERLAVAIGTQAAAQRAFDLTVDFVKNRKVFGGTVFDLQNTRFVLAGLATKIQVGWAHLDWCLSRLVEGKLTSAEASAAKLYHSELQGEVCDAGVQMHGGAGYMTEYAISRLWRDARVTRIYGGTSEIMKELIARSL